MKKHHTERPNKQALYKAIEMLGGVVESSEKLNIHYTGISKWLHTNVDIPIKHAIKIEKMTNGKIKAKDLRPDIFS